MKIFLFKFIIIANRYYRHFTLKNEYPDENQYFIKINKIFYFINLLLLNLNSIKNKELILEN